MSVSNVSKTIIVGLICMPGLSVANQDQNDLFNRGPMGGQVDYPPLQQPATPPGSMDYPQQEAQPPVYPATTTTDVPGDYPPLGYEQEISAKTPRPSQNQSGAVQQSGMAPYPTGPAMVQPQVPQPYPSQGLNVWTPAFGGGPGTPPHLPPNPGAYGAPPPPSAAESYPSQSAATDYPPLSGETSSGYPYSPTPSSATPSYAQPYGGPPPGSYGGFPPAGPYGPHPPPPYYGGPPYPGPW